MTITVDITPEVYAELARQAAALRAVQSKLMPPTCSQKRRIFPLPNPG